MVSPSCLAQQMQGLPGSLAEPLARWISQGRFEVLGVTAPSGDSEVAVLWRLAGAELESRLRAGAHMQLAINVPQMPAHRGLAEANVLGDFFIG